MSIIQGRRKVTFLVCCKEDALKEVSDAITLAESLNGTYRYVI
jgi:hypothetical protein